MARNPTTISSGTILGFYPPSIAQAFQRAINSESADADLLYEDLLGALLSHLAWTTALASGGCGIRSALETGPASLGMLLQIVRSSCTEETGDACDSLLGIEPSTFAASSFHAALDEAIRLRNAVIHENRLDLREPARTAVRKALDHASSLRFQAVIVPRALEEIRGTLRVYRAACYRGLSLRHPIWIETDVELAPKQAYLAIEGRSALLPLHPIAIEGESCAGGALPELYVVRDLARLSVRSTALGREAPARVKAQVESALRDFQPRGKAWLTARHFACPSLAIVASRRLGPDDTIAEKYRIVKYLGSGHASDVYEAVDDRGEARALKLVSAEIAAEAQVLERFRREVGVLRRIQHRNVLRHVDDGEDAGARFVVTELATGWSVRDETVRDASELLASARGAGTAGLDEATVLSLARDVAAGLAELHEQGIVHRDVKLSNVLLFEDAGGRRAVLGDLGIARGFGSSAVTYDGLPVGTPESMAPECGETRDAAPTLDVYAFGILLYEALAGAPPFRGATPQETRAKHRSRLPPLSERAPHASAGLVSLVRACLAKNPASRPRHGADLHARLQRLHESMPDPATAVDIVRGHRLGHYAVHEPIGEIQGATLFRAIDDRTGATVRVGILDDAIEADEPARRYALEVLAALQATHCETLVSVREYGEGDGYTWFLAEDAAPRQLTAAPDLGAASVLDAARGAAAALAAWTARGLTHGDVRQALRVHGAHGGKYSSALLDLPALRRNSLSSDTQDLVDLVLQALERAEVGDGHQRRARSRALVRLRRLVAHGAPSPRELGAWARIASEDLEDASMLGRSLRAVRHHRVASGAIMLLAATGAGFGLQRVRAEAALEDRAERQLRLVAAHLQANDVCQALAACRADLEAATATRKLSGRASILEILCAAHESRPLPPLSVLEPLERAIEHEGSRDATDVVRIDPRGFLVWARPYVDSPNPIPDEVAYAFWRTTVRAIYRLIESHEHAEILDEFLQACERHFGDAAPPRARTELDSCLAAHLENLDAAMVHDDAAALRVVQLATARLASSEPAWNRYSLECHRVLAASMLLSGDPEQTAATRGSLQELASQRSFDEGLRHSVQVTNRVYESGYLPSTPLQGATKLRERCALRAQELSSR